MNAHRSCFVSVSTCFALGVVPGLASAQSILGSASDFALLGGSAITSVVEAGSVISGGNLGLSPTGEAAITGFPPALVVGGTIIPTGTTTAVARFDLITASTALGAMAAGQDLTGQDIGGMTLTSGVYSFAATAGQTGELTLDAQGNSHAFWVFNIGTSLTTAANSSVTFINLAADNGNGLGLFWNAGTTITLGADNVFAGNYLAGTGASFGASSIGFGRVLSLTAITLDRTMLDVFGGPGGGDFTGGLGYDTNGVIVQVPEPATSVALLSLAALGLAGWRRRRA